MSRPRASTIRLFAATLLLGALLLPGAADGAKKKKAKSKATPTPAAAPEHYGPPAPSDRDFGRAAGVCLLYEPGQHIVVAEVGEKGRAFWIDSDTVVEAKVAKGVRVRVLYTDGADGPLARKILPGPVEHPGRPTSPGATPAAAAAPASTLTVPAPN